MFRVDLVLAILLLAVTAQSSQARVTNEKTVKSSTFLSPKIVLGPGEVAEKYFYNVDFPRGHIAIKNFSAEVVDEVGNPVPLYETYLHHWLIVRYYIRKGVEIPNHSSYLGFQQSDFIVVKNSGLCEAGLSQYFGLGSETRKTQSHVPDPYGIVVGNEDEIPEGYEERWLLNVHAIDTRGTEDKLRCTECKCDLYNVTVNKNGRPLRPGYIGGLECCYDGVRCRLEQGFNHESGKRGLFMRYKIEYVDWDSSIVPVKIYIFDVTDRWRKSEESITDNSRHICQIEYQVDSGENSVIEESDSSCTNKRKVSLSIPTGGDVIYAVAHQHTGGIGSALYGEDGRVLCKSYPTYGNGKEVGNEAGYIVGMSTCYPKPGSVTISAKETLTLESNYSSSVRHTGVMGLFYILVAEHPSQKPISFSHAEEGHETTKIVKFVWVGTCIGVVIAIAGVIVAVYKRFRLTQQGYEPI
jgi:hypothetical protein